MLARAVAGSGIRPQTVLLGGDYVGGMSDMTPIFSIRDIYDEVYAIVDPLNTRVMMTYGSHDNNCTEGYDAFYSGPRRSDPIVVMSHVPLHATRGDNVGAMTWYKALTASAQTHDVLLL